MSVKGRSGRNTHLAVRWLMLVSICIYSLGPEPLWANPVGGQVVAGSATISSNGNTLTVNQATNRAIINWQSFSINSGQTTYIAQPNSASAELDRVIGGSASSLLGSLGSNGQVYLINPSGIVFGKGFELNTSGFLASTLDVSNASFMAGGNLTFSGNSTAGITNNGTLTSTDGDVFLFASSIINNGTIHANGTAGLAAGSDILLASSGQQRVFIQAGSQPGTVVNKGTVQAVAAELKAVGGNAGALAINNTGTVRATGVANIGGHIWLTAVNGDISNSGSLIAQDSQGNGGTIQVQASSNNPKVTPATVTNSGTINTSGTATSSSVGGSVVVTGDNVHLTSTSTVNVAGNAGGGTALIGGGSHGTDATVLDAQTTTVDAGSQIIADALLTGNGGQVVVWSNNDTEYFGNISAQGGSQSGNGGNVEVSGGYLNFQGTVNTLAANGGAGDLLLDPYSIDIGGATTTNVTTTGTTTNSPNSTGPPISNISWATLSNQLTNGNVLVTTDGAGPTGTPPSGNITVISSVSLSYNSPTTLTLTANNNNTAPDDGSGGIFFNDGVSVANTGSGALILNAGAGGVQFGTDGSASGTVLNFIGAVTINSTGGVTENGTANISAGTLYLEGGGTAAMANANAVSAISTANTTYAGVINFSNGTNNLTIGDGTHGITTSNDNVTSSGGSLTLVNNLNAGTANVTMNSAGGGITENAGGSITASNLYLEGGGTATLSSASNDISAISTSNTTYAGTITFNNGTNNLTVGDGTHGVTTSNDNVTLTGGSLTLVNNLNAGTANVTLNSAGGVTETAGGSVTASNLYLEGGGTASLSSTNNNVAAISTSNTTYNGSITFNNSSTNLTVGDGVNGITATSNVALTNTGGLTVGEPLTSTAGSVTLLAGQNVSVAGAVSGSSNVSITSSNGAISNSGLGTIDSTAGNITIDAPSTTNGSVDLNAFVGSTSTKGGAGASITITAGTTLTVDTLGGVSVGIASESSDGTINLTSGTTMSIGGGGVGNSKTQNVTITNGGTLSSTNGAIVESTTVTLDGTGGILTPGTPTSAGLDIDAANLVLNEGSSTGPIWVDNDSSSLTVTGTVASDFALTTGVNDSIVIGNATTAGLTSSENNPANLIYLQTGSGGSITQTATSTGITFTHGNGSLVLDVQGTTGAGTVGTYTAPAAAGGPSTTALQTSGVATLAGAANGGIYVNNTSTGLLTVGTVTPSSFSGLGALTGAVASGAAPSGGVQINTDGGLTVTGPVTAINQGVQLVGNYLNGAVTINGHVSAGTAGTGTLTIIGSPTINTTPTVGLAPTGNVYISDQDPNGALLTTIGSAGSPFVGNLDLTATLDYRVFAGVYLENGTLTIQADDANAGTGGIVFLTSLLNGTTPENGFVNIVNGNLILEASDLQSNYNASQTYTYGANTYTITGGTNYGGASGNGIVFSEANGAVIPITMSGTGGGGLVDFVIKEPTGTEPGGPYPGVPAQNLSVVQEGTNETITDSPGANQNTTTTIEFYGQGDVGQSYSSPGTPDGTPVNPLQTEVYNLQIFKTATADNDVYINDVNPEGITVNGASTFNILNLVALGSVGQTGAGILTGNYLDVTSRTSNIDFDDQNNVNEIDLGNAAGSFTYDGAVALTVGGPITSGSTTTIDLGTNTFTQDAGIGATINGGIGDDITLTFGAGTQGDVIGNPTSDVFINNTGLFQRNSSTNDQAVLVGSSVTFNDQSPTAASGSVGVSTNDPILMDTPNLSFSKTGVGSATNQMYLSDDQGVVIEGTANTNGSITLVTAPNTYTGIGGGVVVGSGDGSITLSAAKLVVGGTASFITYDGNINLVQPSSVANPNSVAFFGVVTANDGYFSYDGSGSPTDTVFTQAIKTTGNETSILPGSTTPGSYVSILFGDGATYTFDPAATINATGAVTITRNNNTTTGEIVTAGDIATTSDPVTFTADEGTLNVLIDGDDINGNPFITINTANAPAQPLATGTGGNVLINATVGSSTAYAYGLTVDAGIGNITFTQTVGNTAVSAEPAIPLNGQLGNMVLNSSGTTTFEADVAAESLVVNHDYNELGGGAVTQLSGTTVIEGAETAMNGTNVAVSTTGFQIYNNSTVISSVNGSNTALNGVGIEFNGTLNSQTTPVNLVLNDGGITRFNNNAGTVDALQTLTVNNSSAIDINVAPSAQSNFPVPSTQNSTNVLSAPIASGITIQTIGSQTYGTPGTTSTITFGGGNVGGGAGGASSADVLTTYNGGGDTTPGNITFNATLNGVTPYNNNVVLTAGPSTSSTGNGNIAFGYSTINTVPLGNILITSADNVTIPAAATPVIVASTFLQSTGFGTTTVSGGIQTDSQATPSNLLSTYASSPNDIINTNALAGGVQIINQWVYVIAPITADDGGVIQLVGLGPGTGGIDGLSSVLISGQGAVVDADSGGSIYLTSMGNGTNSADVTIQGGSLVETTTSGSGGTIINASDDVVVNGTGGTTEGTIVRTYNGGISITADNDLIDPTDNANGVLIEAGTDPHGVTVDANGTITPANGTLTITSTVTSTNAANKGELEILGGSVTGASATVESSGTQTVHVNGGNNTLGIPYSTSTAVVVEGGTAANTAATLTTTTTTANQSITADTGDVIVQGGSAGAAKASISSDASTSTNNPGGAVAQLIQVNSGNLYVESGTTVANTSANISADTTGATQTITVKSTSTNNGDITVQGGGGNAYISNGQSNDDTQTQNITAGQNISVLGSTTLGGKDEALIEAGGNQTVIAAHDRSGNILVQGGTQSGSMATIQSFGVGTSTNSVAQTVTVVDAGNITVQGGNGSNSAASIQASDIAQNITVNNGYLDVLADDTNNNAGDALVEDTNPTGVQTVSVTNGGILVQGGLSDDTAALETTGTNSQQSITLYNAGSFDVYSGSGAAADATVESAGLNNGTNDAQSIIVDNGNLNIWSSAMVTASGSSVAVPATGNDSEARVLVSNSGSATQFVQVNSTSTSTNPAAGNINLTGGIGTTTNSGGLKARLESAGFGTSSGLSQSISAEYGITLTGGGINGDAGGNTAQIKATGVDSQQFIQITGAGNITLNAGAGTDANALIEADGINGTNFVTATGADSAQQIYISDGNLNLTGGSDPTNAGSAYLLSTNSGATTNPNTNGQYINVIGNITLQGGTGNSGSAYIKSDGFSITGGPGVAQSITATSNITLTGGTGPSSTAFFSTTGLNSTQNVSSSNGNLALLGGDGTNSPAYIKNAGLQQTILVNNGNLTVTGNQTTTNGGSFANIVASNPAGNQSINVEGTSTTNGNITLTGGVGGNDYASITASNTQAIGGPIGSSTNVTPISGNITLQGGGNGATTNSYAAITATSNQYINVVGSLSTYGSSNSTVTSNNNYALIYGATDTNSTQTIIAGQGIILEGQQGDSSGTPGDINSIGAAIVANNTQSITTTSNGGIFIEGGTLAGSAAGIDETAQANGLATQTISATGLNSTSDSVTLEGGTAGNGDEALIYSSNSTSGSNVPTQDITAITGGILIEAMGADSQQPFGNFSTIGAGIVATNSQLITVDVGGLTMLGGSTTGGAAVIDEAANPDNEANQTLNIAGTTLTSTTNGIYLEGGSSPAISNEALIYSAATTGEQMITTSNGGLAILANGATSAFKVKTSEGRTYNIGAGIEANTTQNITVDTENLTITGGTAPGASAVIAMLNTGTTTNSTQTINVDNGSLIITGGTGTGGLPAGAGILSLGVDNGGQDAQSITVLGGNVTLTADQTSNATSSNDAFIDLYAANGYNTSGATQFLNDGISSSTNTANTNGSITLQGGSGTGDWAYLESTGVQTLENAGGQSTSNTPFATLSSTLGLGVAGGSGTNDYAIVKSDGTQVITIDLGDVQVLGGSGSNDTAAVYTASAYTGAQTITIDDGNLVVNGGTGSVTTQFDGGYYASNAAVDSEAVQTITVASTSTTTNANITVNGGTGNGGAANIQSLNTQSITTSSNAIVSSNAITGNVTVQGGGTTSTTGAYAAITATSNQYINVAGVLGAYGSTQSTNTDNNDYALIYGATDANSTQTIIANQGIVLEGKKGNSSGTPGDINSIGAAIVANNTQSITTTSNGGIFIEGGTLAGSAAGIDETAQANGLATQTISATGLNSTSDSITLEGGTAGNGDEALIYSSNSASGSNVPTQDITAITGGILIEAMGADSQQPFGNFSTIGAGIVATNSQLITVDVGGLTMLGGSTTGGAAVIDEAANPDNEANQTLNIAGTTLTSTTNGIYLEGGSSPAISNEALIYSAATTGEQMITTSNGGLAILANGATSAFAVKTSEGRTYNIGAGIEANTTQNITVDTENLTITGGSAPGASAVIAMLNTGTTTNSTQTIDVDNGNLTITGGTGTGGLPAGAGILSLGIDNGGQDAQSITVLGGNVTLTADQTSNATSSNDAFIDLYAANGYNTPGATQFLNDGISSSTNTANTNGYITLQGGSGTGDWAYLESTGVQTIENAGGQSTSNTPFATLSSTLGLGVAGGSGTTGYAIVKSDGTQMITIDQGDVQVLGGSGVNDVAAVYTASAYTGAQTIVIDDGNLVVNGYTGSVTTQFDGGYYASNAAVDSEAVQTITVASTSTTTNANITVTGGTGNGGAANIQSLNTQSITTSSNAVVSSNAVTGNVMVQGGGTTSTTGAYAAITATSNQYINVAGNLNVYGSTQSTNTDNNDYGLVQSGDTQTLTIGGSLSIWAKQGSSSGAVGPLSSGAVGPPGTSSPTSLGAAVIANNNQDIAVGNVTTDRGILSVLGGTTAGSGASLQMNNQDGSQNIDVYGQSSTTTNGITTGDSLDVLGGATTTGSNAYASIVSEGNQQLGENFNTVDGHVAIPGNVVVEGGAASGNAALIWADTVVSSSNQSQALAADGNIDFQGGTGSGAYASMLMNYADIYHGQEIFSGSNSNSLNLTAGTGTGSYADVNFESPQGFQYIVINGSINLQDATGGNAYINSESTDYYGFVGDTLGNEYDQYVEAKSGNINLTADNGNDAYISGANRQTILADNGAINLTGTNGGEAYITALYSFLTMGGSATSTWTGNAVIGTDGVTQYVYIDNNDSIVISNPPANHVHIYADTGMSEIEFAGNSTNETTIGSTSNRLVTKTDLMQFDNSNKNESIYVDNVLPVMLEGSIGTLDLITTNTASGADAVTDGSNGLIANMVSITTSNGGINLTNPNNDVTAFDTINAQGTAGSNNEFQYTGSGNVALNGPITTTSYVDINVGGNTITFGNGNVTSGTYQTYQSNVVLGTNSTLQAGNIDTGTSDINFDGTLSGGGGIGNSLIIAGGDATFHKGAGTIGAPLYNLTLGATPGSGVIGNFLGDLSPTTPITGPDDMTLSNPSLVLNHSFINHGLVTVTNSNSNEATFVVDNGSVGPGSGIFQGGNIDILTGMNVTFYVPIPSSLTGTVVGGGQSLPTTQVYSAWEGNPAGPDLLKPYAYNTIFYKNQPSTLIIPFPELTTLDLNNVSNGLYSGYQLGGDNNNPGGGTGENGGNGGGEENGSQNPGTLAGTQQYPFVSVVNVAGYGPSSDDGDGQVWIGSGPGYLTFGSSDELSAGSSATLFPPDEEHFPKKLKHKPISSVPPQVESSGPDR